MKKNPASTMQAWRQAAHHQLDRTLACVLGNFPFGMGKNPQPILNKTWSARTDQAKNARI
jgi:hypothetical protein